MTLQNTLHPIIYEDIRQITSLDIPLGDFKNKTILISGANGFLASYLVYYFLLLNDLYSINCHVIGICRKKQKAEDKFHSLLERRDLTIVLGDTSKPLEIKGKIDFIIHAASPASPLHFGADPVGTINANVLGTNNLLNLAQTNEIQSFLFFSSGEVYGSVASDRIPTKENEYGYIDINNVRSCYAESKRLGETMCISWFHQHNIPTKIVRPFHTYGPGMNLKDGRVYADFVADIVGNRDLTMKSDGSAKRAFCYLRDATEGFIRVLLNGESGHAYNIGNPKEEISVMELAEKLILLFPEKNLQVQKQLQEAVGYLESPISRNSPNIEKALALGWRPKTSLGEGFKRTVESYLLC